MPDVARAALDAAIAATSAAADAAPAAAAAKTTKTAAATTPARTASGDSGVTTAAAPADNTTGTGISPALANVLAAARAANAAQAAVGQASQGTGSVSANAASTINKGVAQNAVAAPQTSLPSPASGAGRPSAAARVAAATTASTSGAPAAKAAGATSDRADAPAAGASTLAAAQAGLLSGPAVGTAGRVVVDAAPLDRTQPTPADGTADQIVQTMRLQALDGGGVAEIRLQPEQFGNVTISLHVSDGQVSARLQADSPAARDWLQANADTLRHGLSTHNLTLDRLEIAEPPSNSSPSDRRGTGDRAFRDQPPPRRQPRRAPSGAGETFELIA
jgi:flagellar hook-length control protein FliK